MSIEKAKKAYEVRIKNATYVKAEKSITVGDKNLAEFVNGSFVGGIGMAVPAVPTNSKPKPVKKPKKPKKNKKSNLKKYGA